MLPLIPCDEIICDWYIREDKYNNCFWVLAQAFTKMPCSLSLDEIARLEGITLEQAKELVEHAMKQYRANVSKVIKEI